MPRIYRSPKEYADECLKDLGQTLPEHLQKRFHDRWLSYAQGLFAGKETTLKFQCEHCHQRLLFHTIREIGGIKVLVNNYTMFPIHSAGKGTKDPTGICVACVERGPF